MQSIENTINQLKKERNAVILAHNYQRPEVQDIADFTGDSLELSQEAAKVRAEIIVFCGVHFMAETAAIINPSKTVLIPDPAAGCPMADMINAEQVIKLKAKHPGAVVVCYVNSSAAVKAESDYCCTSANAVDIVAAIPKEKEVIFIPDRHLGRFVAEKLQRPMVIWEGYCPTHVAIRPEDITKQKALHPQAKVLVHPECTKPVSVIADSILSTGQMRRYIRKSDVQEFIIGTEVGILHSLRNENPDKKFYPASERATCPNMKKITLEKILWSLQDKQKVVTVPEEIRTRAFTAIERMLKMSH